MDNSGLETSIREEYATLRDLFADVQSDTDMSPGDKEDLLSHLGDEMRAVREAADERRVELNLNPGLPAERIDTEQLSPRERDEPTRKLEVVSSSRPRGRAKSVGQVSDDPKLNFSVPRYGSREKAFLGGEHMFTVTHIEDIPKGEGPPSAFFEIEYRDPLGSDLDPEKDEIQFIELEVPFSELRTSRDAFYTFSKHIPIYNAAKGPLAQDLIAKCRSTYEKFYKNPTRRNLKKVFEFLESIKKSQFKTVREEHGRCLRAAKRAQASLGFEGVSKKVPRKQRIYVNGSSDVPDNVRDKGLYRRIRERKKRSVSVWPSAYASGQVVQEYKRAGGRYWG